MDVFVFALDVHTLRRMNSPTRWITVAAGLLGLLGVALGAFGAHALKDTLAAGGHTGTWQTAVLYHLIHAVALLGLAGWRDAHGGPDRRIAWCWVAGVVMFSGSLYALSLGGPRFLGPVTPLGGVAFIAGWALVAWNAWKPRAA
jgi:uncharacterized membrane protein YgdD (TMEM256/DUF423 family)